MPRCCCRNSVRWRIAAEERYRWPAPAWLQRAWGRGIVAFTAPWAIYVHPATLAVDEDRLGPLIVHELAHTEQWRRSGWVRQAVTYVASYLRARLGGRSHLEAYRQIPQEVEARRVSDLLVGQSPL